MNENENKVEEIQEVISDIQEVSKNNKLVSDAGGKSKAGLILIGILSVLGLVKVFGLIKNFVKKIKTKKARKYAESHPDEFVTRKDIENQDSDDEPEEEKTLDEISNDLRSK